MKSEIIDKINRGDLLTEEEFREAGFTSKHTCIVEYILNGVFFEFYGGILSGITVNGESIEDIFDIPGARTADDELEYRISKDAIKYAYRKAGLL